MAGGGSDLRRTVLAAVRPYARHAMGFSLAANLLLLVSPLYMLQVYDRVLTSGSTDTLAWLTLIAVFLLAVYAAADSGRRSAVAVAGEAVERVLTARAFARYERGGAPGDGLDADLARTARITAPFSGGQAASLIDLPFSPFFLLVLFLIHPVMGVVGLAGGAVVLGLAALAEVRTRPMTDDASGLLSRAQVIASAAARQRDAVVGMGMTSAVAARHADAQATARTASLAAAHSEAGYSGVTKAARQVLQVLILGTGAALALGQAVSPGAIVAGSIIMSRALAPVDQIVASWRPIIRARTAWAELEARLTEDAGPDPTPMPRPAPALRCERLAVAVPGATEPLIQPFGLKVSTGALIGLVGGIGSGKSSLLKTLSGAWMPASGTATLGARAIHAWGASDRGRHVGYVPQSAELMPGTVKENIARFGDADDAAIYAAVQTAGASGLVAGLPAALDTPVGPGGVQLSAGQAQLVALARALLSEPVLLLLDEPTASLDGGTAQALVARLKALAQAGTIVLAATHDPRLVTAADNLLVLTEGKLRHEAPQAWLGGQQEPKLRIAAERKA